MTFALDSESSYAKGRDIRSLGVQKYLRHPETEHYLVSAYGDHTAVSEPAMFDWSQLQGATLLSHNASYDASVIAELRRRGMTIPKPNAWHCTADLASYLQAPRSLTDASSELLGIKLDKTVRDQMKGQVWDRLSADERVMVAEYCLLDSKACYMLWQQFGHQWPDHERDVSAHTAMMCRRGIGLDLPRIAAGIKTLQQAKWEAEGRIPWAGELTAKGKEQPITSPLLIAVECRRRRIEPPASTDAKSEEFGLWLQQHETQADFILAVQQWRQANRLLSVLETMQEREVEGVLHYGLKYFGATHTGRWSGDAGLNLQNLPRKPFAGVDARACLVPRPGKVFVVADLAQIEARVTCWLAGDERMLDLLRAGMDLYEAHARRTMGYTDLRPLKDVDKDLRQFAKCRVLGLGFGLGGVKFQRIVKQWAGKDIALNRAKDIVNDFRRTNPGIIRLWRQLELGVKQSCGGDFEVELPSGRMIHYFNIAEIDGQRCGRVERGQPRKTLYGGLLTENLVQATARDLFAEAILRLERAGLPVVLHVHDEVVVEVDERAGAEALRAVNEIMCVTPPWAAGLPIQADTQIAQAYGK
jgi:hypothetical protein